MAQDADRRLDGVTPLEATKRMRLIGVEECFDGDDLPICLFCEQQLTPDEEQEMATGHAEICPWTRMPRIVAALEAAEQLVGTDYVLKGDPVPPSYLDARKVNALVAALKGEEVPTRA